METKEKPESNKPSTVASFFRYNVSALLATAGDFLTLILLTELAGLWYVLSTSIGAFVGALIAFSLGRNWAFVSKEEKKRIQIIRYTIVAAGSLILNTAGVYFFTDTLGFDYIISKVITAVIVAIAFNYPLSKFYIFR
ncbi:MAG: GtrA family protein [Cyclobacteriaceae bacterium]